MKLFNIHPLACGMLLLMSILFLSCNKGAGDVEEVYANSISSYYSTKLEYPVYHGVGEVEFNKEIEQYLKKQMFNIAKQSRLVCERDNEPGNLLPEMSLTYEILQQDGVYLSIRFSTYINWNNDFSPSLYYDCFNFSVKEHKFIKIQDFLIKRFSNQDKALKALRLICEKKMFNEDEVYCKSLMKSDKDFDVFENFSITSNHLILKFDNISLETNMCGNPEVDFTEQELKAAYSKIAD